jgi:hypothetical protein
MGHDVWMALQQKLAPAMASMYGVAAAKGANAWLTCRLTPCSTILYCAVAVSVTCFPVLDSTDLASAPARACCSS